MDSKMSKKVLAVIAAVLLIFTGYLAFTFLSAPKQTEPEMETAVSPTSSIPTRTPEERQMIEAVKDYIVTIKNNSLDPTTITVKVRDQVFWENKDTVAHKIAGEGWGGLSIKPEGRFMQSFEKAGTYKYSLADKPEVTGTVVVE